MRVAMFWMFVSYSFGSDPDPEKGAQHAVAPVVERILIDGDAAALLHRDDHGPGGGGLGDDGLGVGRERAENHHPAEKNSYRHGAENTHRASGFHENLRRSGTGKGEGSMRRGRNNAITMGHGDRKSTV